MRAISVTRAMPGRAVRRVRRYQELDSLRGAMMMLGVALHAAVGYMRTPLDDLWGFKDSYTNGGFDVFVAFVHTFRMPVFFVMAGFFAAMLYEQRGASRMIQNRIRRVLGPLVVGWVVLFPLTIAGFAFAQLGGDRGALVAAIRLVASAEVLDYLQLIHLWFLFDLLVYYAAALLLFRLGRRALRTAKQSINDGFSWLLERWYAPLVLAVPTTLTLAPMSSGLLETPGTFYRPLATLLAHGVFFAFGWLLFIRRDLLNALRVRAWERTLAACLLFPIHGLAVIRLAEHAGGLTHTVAITSLAVIIWLFVFGLTGLFIRYLARPNAFGRYMADASYWFYLVHLPLVAWGSGLLATQPWPATVKYAVLLSAVIGVCWASYDIAVRPTVIGVLLNGRRYPRGFPSPTSVARVTSEQERQIDVKD